MGSSVSCVPHQNFRFSSKSFIRRNSSRLFRKKNPQEGQVKSNSIINILCTVTPRKEMSQKDLKTIENIKWNPPFAYDPSAGWKKSSVNVKNYGRMIHSSKVRFRFLHCQDIHDCFLDLFQTHLHFVSNNPAGLTYQGTLPLKEVTICKLSNSGGIGEANDFAFQINGVSLNPIIVYCSGQEELDTWFGLLKEHVEANGGSVTSAEASAYTRLKYTVDSPRAGEDLRNSVMNEPIYEWEGSQRESLGPVTHVTKVRLQHLPCKEQYNRLLVMYPSTLIILTEECDGLFYKGKLPLDTVSVTLPCQGVKPNTFLIEGKMIHPIVVSCLDENDFTEWIRHFKSTPATVHIPPPPVYDIIYTPTKTEAPALDRWSGQSGMDLDNSLNKSGSNGLPFLNHVEDLLSPGYTEPLCYLSSRPTSGETRLSSVSSSASSRLRPPHEVRPPSSLRYSSPHCYSQALDDVPPSPVYNTPYTAMSQGAPVQLVEKAPLVKSNSWSTSQTATRYQLSIPQRHSDMCGPRKPLSPLYDDPHTSGEYLCDDNYVRPPVSRQCWEGSVLQRSPQILPTHFRLDAPPLERKYRNKPSLKQEAQHSHNSVDLRTEDFSKLKLSSPTAAARHMTATQATFPTQCQRMSLDYPQGRNVRHAGLAFCRVAARFSVCLSVRPSECAMRVCITVSASACCVCVCVLRLHVPTENPAAIS
ncbi:probable pleckstrin homology domain-containing family N member 1 isoform X2 [Conger conger]|uniref:probable pleckstrin homology domain-containing family N member 1 isoform X2 n=1 Tax=Conger conger TaxID=82655 RepID=UPI002A5A8AB1|nr:probable pleckstrin homology domain-containing family N member 1 isoform X2 [Conger conger]